MNQRYSGRTKAVVTAGALLITAVALGIVFGEQARTPELTKSARLAVMRPTGEPQLVSIEPMPSEDGDGAQCAWLPASANTSLFAELEKESDESASPALPQKRPVDADRKPERVIHDPNPSFSSLAVDPDSNTLMVTDENLFQVLEYGRLDNTPPGAKMTEPKRVIGGNKTKAEMICGVYIDPKTKETYVVNNDTQNWLAIFGKDSKGNVPPDRFLAVPHGAFGIAVDETTQQMFLTIQHQNAVIVYRKSASGNEKPLRELSGDSTELEDPHGICIDVKDNLIAVSNHGNVSYRAGAKMAAGATGGLAPGTGQFHPPSITIYPLDAKGDTAPLRKISGTKTRLNWPAGVAIDEQTGEIYVANDMDHSIAVFKTTDNGDVAPSRLIMGPKTGLRNPTGVSLDMKNKELWVADMGTHTAAAFPLNANGDVAPIRAIRGGPANEPSLMIGNPGAVAYDTKRAQILVPN